MFKPGKAKSAGRSFLLVVGAALALSLTGPGPAHGAETEAAPEDVIIGDMDQLSPDEIDVLYSSAPKNIFVDALTGDLTAVTNAPAIAITPFTAYPNGCTSTRGCWQYPGPTYGGVGFSTGVTNGSWPGVQNFKVGAGRYAKLCWAPGVGLPSTCMPERNGDNATIYIGRVVTGTQVDYQTFR